MCDGYDWDTEIKIYEGDFGAFTFEYTIRPDPEDIRVGPDDP